MSKVCCNCWNCKHNIRTGEAPNIESHCELDGSYIRCVKYMEYRCEHWKELENEDNKEARKKSYKTMTR